MSSNTSGSARPARGLPTPEIDLASAFQPSNAVDHTKGLGGMSRRRPARTAESSTPGTGTGAEAVGTAAAPVGEGTALQAGERQVSPQVARLEVVEPLERPGERGTSSEGQTQGQASANGAQDSTAPGTGSATAPTRAGAASRARRTGSVATGEGGAARSARSGSSTASASTRRTAAEEETKASGRPAATKGGVAYVPAATRDLLARLRGHRGRTFGELVLNALNAQHAQLAELVQQRRPQVVDGPLFSMAAAPSRVLTVQIALRLSQAHWDVLDALVEQYGAANRGELIDAAVQAEYGSIEE